MKSTRRIIILIFVIMLVFSVFPMGVFAASEVNGITYEYKAVKVKTLSVKRSSDPFGSISSSPGLTISLTASKTIARTYSNTTNIGVTIKDINAAMSWTNSKSDTVSVTNAASWRVPKKDKDRTGKYREVRYGYLKGYVDIETVKYKIMRRKVTTTWNWLLPTIVKGPWEDYKYGVATRALLTNVTYERTYKFK